MYVLQIATGYVGDRPSVDTLAFYNLMTSLAGLATLVVPLVTSFPALAAVSAAFGLFVSANYALTTVILVELVGVDRLTDAVGIVSFAQGIANLVGPPLAGRPNMLRSASIERTHNASHQVISVFDVVLLLTECLSYLYSSALLLRSCLSQA